MLFSFRLSALLLAIMLLCTNCYQYRVATQAGPGTELSKPVTAHVFFWGLAQKPKNWVHTPLCDSLGVNGMSEVIVRTNLGYSLITVATLGIWSPIWLQWKCSKPCKKTDTL